MQEYADAVITRVETQEKSDGPCAGGVEKKRRNFKRMKSLKDNRIIHVKKEKPRVKKVFDPTAWYIVEVKKRFTEMKSRDLLNAPQGFINDSTQSPYHVEAYVATQTTRGVEKTIIHGKVFIRVDEMNRIDVLRKCPYLRNYAKDPTLSLTEHNFTDFARVPNDQIERLKAILELADGTVEYSEIVPQVHDQIKLSDGVLAKSALLKDLDGTIEMVNGKTHVTIILNNLGCFKFRLPVSAIRKITNP